MLTITQIWKYLISRVDFVLRLAVLDTPLDGTTDDVYKQ